MGAAEHHLTFPKTVLSDSNLAIRQRKQTELEARPRWLNFKRRKEKLATKPPENITIIGLHSYFFNLI